MPSVPENHTALIVNPNAQGGRVGRSWSDWEPGLRAALGGYTADFTSGRGDATRLCAQALSAGARLVVAVGGDGTASEVTAGFMLAGVTPDSGIAFGYLLCGTGCDLRRTYQSPTDLFSAARAIAAATPRRIDVGQLDFVDHQGRPARTYFINIAGFGLSGLGDQLVNDSRKRFGTTATFIGATLRASLRYRNARVALRLDDGVEQTATIYNVAVANGRYFGGGMLIAPMAQPDDGLLDVVSLGDLSLLETLKLSRVIYQGKHLGLPKVAVARARTLTARPLDAAEAVLLDVDGENPGRLPATFTVLPGRLLLRV